MHEKQLNLETQLQGFDSLIRSLLKCILVVVSVEKCHGNTFSHFYVSRRDVWGHVTSSSQLKMVSYDVRTRRRAHLIMAGALHTIKKKHLQITIVKIL